jgi:hypothetical protein
MMNAPSSQRWFREQTSTRSSASPESTTRVSAPRFAPQSQSTFPKSRRRGRQAIPLRLYGRRRLLERGKMARPGGELTLPQTPGRWKCPEVQLAALAFFRRRSGRVRWGPVDRASSSYGCRNRSPAESCDREVLCAFEPLGRRADQAFRDARRSGGCTAACRRRHAGARS